jgi:hypothetical protein
MEIKDPTGRLARWSIYLQAYDFQIIHRHGKTHSNADALSRPVLMAIENVNTNQSQIEDDSSKALDPHEDEALLHFLKHKIMPSGMSKKNIKRVTKLSTYYELENDQLLYIDKQSNKHLIVPKIELRKQLIEQAHLLGHFQLKTVQERLREEYYWKGMNTDIEKYIRNCLKCLEFQ